MKMKIRQAVELWLATFDDGLEAELKGDEHTDAPLSPKAYYCALGIGLRAHVWLNSESGRDDIVAFIRDWADALSKLEPIENPLHLQTARRHLC